MILTVNIPSLPTDVSLRENDPVTSENLNSPLPSGHTFESFAKVVEEVSSETAGVSEIAAVSELSDNNIDASSAISLVVQISGVESNEIAEGASVSPLTGGYSLTNSILVQPDGTLLTQSATDTLQRSSSEIVEALPLQTQVVNVTSEDTVAMQTDSTEGIASDLLAGLQAINGAKESGFEFSQGNESETESSEPNLKAALPGLIQEESVPLNRSARTTALTAGKMEAVTETVTENLVQQIRLTERGEQKQMTLQLHPAELGQLTLQLDWDKDALQVKILASEVVAADLLKQNKSQLVQALAENGIDFDSLDIGYQSEQSDPRDEGEAESSFMSADLFNELEESDSEKLKSVEQPAARVSTSMIDIRV